MINRILTQVFSGALLLRLRVAWRMLAGGGYFSINGLDKKLSRYLPESEGYFVELGANDGVSQSNTLFFERIKGWRGVLVEPTPEKFMLCAGLRGARNKVFCAACVPFGYTDRFVELQYANLMTVSRGLELDIPDAEEHLQAGAAFLRSTESSYTFGALARPLTELLDEAKSPSHIDLISIDVEGAELEVLRGIDFSRYSFRYLLIECRNLPRVAEYLALHGYAPKDQFSHHDHLFAPISSG